MIKFREQVPSVYPNSSRDFQYLCWLIDIVLNSVKHNVDDLYDLPSSTNDPKLSELLAMSLGFKVKRNYDQTQLAALVEVLPRVLKHKGTITAIEIAGKALVAASGAVGSVHTEVNNGEIEVSLPKALVDISLFTDLLPYILPAGMTCRVIRTDILHKSYETELSYQDNMLADVVSDITWDSDKLKLGGMSTLFEVGRELYEFGNFQSPVIRDDDGTISEDSFNAGLLSNTIIPALHEPLAKDSSVKTTDGEDK